MRSHLTERHGEIMANRKDAEQLANLEQFARLNRHQRRAYAALLRKRRRKEKK